MPNIADFENKDEWMKACVPMMTGEGKDQEEAVAACMSMWGMKQDAAKYRLSFSAIKATGSWKVDITAVPFHFRDSDGQWFDEQTDVKEKNFTTPLVLYQHGIKQGGNDIDEKPVEIGDAVPGSLRKEFDGWHFDAVLKKNNARAVDTMRAIEKKNGSVAVSSDSISHIARLEFGGKLIQYEKDRPGRIAIWPLAGVSMWEIGGGNFRPASHNATALPAMKAMYRQAGIPFPELDTTGVSQNQELQKRAEIAKAEAKKLLQRLENS